MNRAAVSLSPYLSLLSHLLVSLHISLKFSCHSLAVSFLADLRELALPYLALGLVSCNLYLKFAS